MFNFFKRKEAQIKAIDDEVLLMVGAIHKQCQAKDFCKVTRKSITEQLDKFNASDRKTVMELVVNKLKAEGVNTFGTRLSLIFARKP